MSEISQTLQKAEELFLQYIEEIQRNKISDISIRRALKKYDVKNLKIHNVTPLRAKKMYSAIMPKYSSGVTTDKSWLENERRLFIWCTLCYLHKNSLDIHQLKIKDFEYLRQMFPLKELELVKFQIYSLLKKDNKSSSWSSEQDKLLTKLVQKQNLKQIQWSNVSKQFFQNSGEEFFRNAKQCRQRWLNHLDPNKTKGKWQAEQDIILLRKVKEGGKKWSKIVEALSGKKNQHMIKNRYKSLIHKKQKACKNSKMKQQMIIDLILRQYEQKVYTQQQNQNQKQNYMQNDSSHSDSQQNQSQIQEQQEQKPQVQKYELYQQPVNSHKLYQQPAKIYKKNSNNNTYSLDLSSNGNGNTVGASISMNIHAKKNNTGIIINPKTNINTGIQSQKQECKPSAFVKSNNFQSKFQNWKILVEPKAEFKQPVEKIEQNDKQYQKNTLGNNQVQLCGSKVDKQFVNNLFYTVNTPIAQQNRIPPIILQNRSPAGNVFLSPFPACWTPTIFLVDDLQNQPSPKVEFANFSNRFKSTFSSFIQDR